MNKKKIKTKKILKEFNGGVLLLGDKKICDEFKKILEKADIKILDFKKSTKKSVRKNDLICAIELTNTNLELKRKNLIALNNLIPKSIPIISSSICLTVSSQNNFIKNPERLIGICGFPILISKNLIEIAPSIKTKTEIVEKVREFFAKLGKKSIIVQDRIGMVMPRILSQIINEAFFTIQQNIASPSDIDLVMKLGTNYPDGPITMGEKIGFDQIESVLKALFFETREERYRISPLLTQFSESIKN